MEDRENSFDMVEEMLRGIADRVVTGAIVAGGAGILSGVSSAKEKAEELGLTIETLREEGSEIAEGEEVARFSGNPGQIAAAEEYLIGLLAKFSGIATAARDFVKAAGKKPRVVCTALNTMPPADREAIRLAIASGGAGYRISENPYVYLDNKCIEMFGGIREGMEAVSRLEPQRTIVVQLRGKHAGIIKEALEAAECGAGIIFVDTGVPLDFMEAAFELERAGLRKKVKIAFGGNLDMKGVRGIKKDKFGIEIVDIGSSIVDAPLLDMRLEITAVGDNRSDQVDG